MSEDLIALVEGMGRAEFHHYGISGHVVTRRGDAAVIEYGGQRLFVAQCNRSGSTGTVATRR